MIGYNLSIYHLSLLDASLTTFEKAPRLEIS